MGYRLPLALSTTVLIPVLTVLASAPSAGAAVSLASSSPSTTVWLCRPGQTPDPCSADLTATVVPGRGARSLATATPATSSPFDCFYVYPTVVNKARGSNAPLRTTPALAAAAMAQASRFSPLCNVWAPVYRQRTGASLAKGLGNDPAADATAFASVKAAFDDYLAHDNDGRPLIVLGQSQGAAMLIDLLRSEVDADPQLRSQLVMAMIIGGNITVPRGRTAGATFQHIPLCTRVGQSGCVIAYSSFGSRPPKTTNFGRPGQGVSLQSGQRASAGLQVACTNPAALGGGSGLLDPYFLSGTVNTPPPPVATPWVAYPNRYRASCQSTGGATWLQVTPTSSVGDTRPVVKATLGRNWGYHAFDVNLALGNLVGDVSAAEQTWNAAHRN
jgi:Protein of unknown function (DUF3089)